ncbi:MULTISPECIES: hypothetical protein [unclassified Sulfitobacter]|uniref:hypothetical protein n=1 Tax=Sulfitobacter phage pCB2047-C TaxID=754043 RepID=UPI0002C043C9|nr:MULTISPECIES: hypothetical protein [unclassified Sulfitobacter]YP_007675280.1 hypothetical protein SUBG_00023 [Sulfitobacter phage pCB2047-C]YP_007675450.1 hypothetical protein SUAG_00058 [Sulfitobacter phage pCB2047-A]YP_009146180.1 hypothetical protein SUFP_006 [Sulfitobacter phage NYA-2014a]AGG91193.1 hypothetical protein SUBG_00023 [Sulfitobacter phage pCB2047-C]AGH30784.1 hypothetical protein SUAG_00058 [Sulfitobacter phage pCB2047-A]AIM40637.1 hypothetical protein SUFP_006 [Sulfitoba
MTDTIQDRLRRTEKDTDLEGDVFHIPVNPDGPAAAAHIDAQDAKIKALVEALECQDRVLRSSAPDPFKMCKSPVGAVQGYIAEMEGVLDGLGYDVAGEEYAALAAAKETT